MSTVATGPLRLEPLKGYNAFGRVFGTGKRFSNGSVTALVVFRTPEEAPPSASSAPPADRHIVRFGVTSRKRTRPAVLRNRIKRLLRESLRQVLRDYEHAGERPPFRELVLVWNAVPRKSSLLRLHTVLPAVRDLTDRAMRSYRREFGESTAP